MIGLGSDKNAYLMKEGSATCRIWQLLSGLRDDLSRSIFVKGACSSPTTENFPQLSCHYECPISGLQGLHWNTEKRDLLQFLFCPQVQFDFECERTLRTGANMNWIFCSCIKKIKKENVTAAENLKIRPLVFSSQRTNFKSTDENMSPSLSSNIKASKSLFRDLWSQGIEISSINI